MKKTVKKQTNPKTKIKPPPKSTPVGLQDKRKIIKKENNTSNPQIVKPNKTNSSVFEEGDFSDFKTSLNNNLEWILEVNPHNKYPVIVWLDKINDKSCLLTIFPTQLNVDIPNNAGFPLSIPISRFPKKNNNPPYLLNQFGIANCNYSLYPKKSSEK